MITRFLFLCIFSMSVYAIAGDILSSSELKGGTGDDDVGALAISENGNVVAALKGRGVYFWENGGPEYSLRTLNLQDVKALAVDDNGFILAGANDGRLWFLERGSQARSFAETHVGTINGEIMTVAMGTKTAQGLDFYVLYQGQTLNLEKWNIGTAEHTGAQSGSRQLSIEVPRNTASFILNPENTQITTSSYHTNANNRNNKFMIYNAATLNLEKNTELESPAHIQTFGSMDKEKIGIWSGFNNFFLMEHDDITQFIPVGIEYSPILGMSFHSNAAYLVVADSSKTIRFFDLTSTADATAFIWPFFYDHNTKAVFNTRGTYMTAFSKSEGLRRWELPRVASTPYAEMRQSPVYRWLTPPVEAPKGDEYELDCRIEGNQLVLTNNSGVECKLERIYWYIRDAEDELLVKGSSPLEKLEKGASRTFTLEQSFENNNCFAAFYLRRPPSGP